MSTAGTLSSGNISGANAPNTGPTGTTPAPLRPRTPVQEGNIATGAKVSKASYMSTRFLGAISSFKTHDPLNNENWVAWKGQIWPMLELNGVDSHCKGPGIAPPVTDVDWRAEWDRAERVARIIISNNLSAPQFIHVLQAATVKQMWDNLWAVHEVHRQQSINALRRTLYDTKAQEGDDILAHTMKMCSLQADLHMMGLMVNDNDFTNILAASLLKSWDPFMASYMGSQNGAQPLLSQTLIGLLQEEWTRRGGSMETAMNAKQSKGGKGSGKAKGNGKKSKERKCHICAHMNHLAKDCFHRGKPKCENCGCFNHKTSECRVKKDKDIKSVPTKNGKHHKVESTQQVCDIHDDEEMEDAMYATHRKHMSGDTEITECSWLIDSATLSHITNRRENFTSFTPLHKTVKGVEGVDVPVEGKGTVGITSRVNGHTWTMILNNVLYVPQAPNNLFSVTHLDENGGHAKMDSGITELYDKEKNKIAVGHKIERMYLLNGETLHKERSNVIKEASNTSWEEWHKRFGHISVSGLQHMNKGGLVDGFEAPKDKPTFECVACTKVKQTRNPFPRKQITRTMQPGELIHTDLWEVREMGIHRVKYYISFIDDCSWCVTIECLKTKDQTTEKIKNYVAHLECQYAMKPKGFCADNGGEYIGIMLKQWCEQNGIKLEYTAPHSPEQNGVAEQMNRTLAELVRAMMFGTSVPVHLWPEAMRHAAYLRNRTHTWALEGQTPLERWSGTRPNVAHLHEFGGPIWILNEGPNQSELVPKSMQHTFMGFEDGPKAIRYYDARTRQVRVSRNFCFIDLSANTTPTNSTQGHTESVLSEGECLPGKDNESNKRKRSEKETDINPRRSTHPRVIHNYQKLDDPWDDEDEQSNQIKEDGSPNENPDDEDPLMGMSSAERVYAAFCETKLAPENPKTIKEARESPDWPEWEAVIQTKLDQLHKMGTWELVDPPEGRVPVSNK